MRWIENLYGSKRTGAESLCPAPATPILRDSVRKGEKIQTRISSCSSPIYVLQARLLFHMDITILRRENEQYAGCHYIDFLEKRVYCDISQ
jgi:hypothetical protein